ncbi:glycoside hydrolase family 95-like protein [Niabella hibiscisoli]|uniref:glycoside hydrolase family 95-like protein n=1 Tax=Niabella hibiscisoli TaxID=1825928 RepID=UPI00374D71A1
MAEMLVQSHEGFIELLPALPALWANGRVKGLVARGAFVINMSWNNGQLSTASIYSKAVFAKSGISAKN